MINEIQLHSVHSEEGHLIVQYSKSDIADVQLKTQHMAKRVVMGNWMKQAGDCVICEIPLRYCDAVLKQGLRVFLQQDGDQKISSNAVAVGPDETAIIYAEISMTIAKCGQIEHQWPDTFDLSHPEDPCRGMTNRKKHYLDGLQLLAYQDGDYVLTRQLVLSRLAQRQKALLQTDVLSVGLFPPPSKLGGDDDNHN